MDDKDDNKEEEIYNGLTYTLTRLSSTNSGTYLAKIVNSLGQALCKIKVIVYGK